MDWTSLGGLAWLLAGGAVFYLMMRRGGCGMGGHAHHGRRHEERGAAGAPPAPPAGAREAPLGAEARDPVCGMPVDPARAAGTRTLMGRTFHLCSKDCLDQFDRDPMAYAHRAMEAVPPTATAPEHHGHRHAGC